MLQHHGLPVLSAFLKNPIVCAYGLSYVLNAESLKRTHNFCNMTPRNQI